MRDINKIKRFFGFARAHTKKKYRERAEANVVVEILLVFVCMAVLVQLHFYKFVIVYV